MARRGDNGRTEERKEKKNLHCRSKRVQVRKWAQTQAVVSRVFSKGLRVFPVAFCCNAPGRKLTAQSESDTISYESSFFSMNSSELEWTARCSEMIYRKIIYTLLLIQSEQVRNHTELAALAEPEPWPLGQIADHWCQVRFFRDQHVHSELIRALL